MIHNPLSFNHGVIYVTVSFRNVKLALTDVNGVVKMKTSSGCLFKNSKKKTSHAAITTAMNFFNMLKNLGLESAECVINGVNYARESCIRAINSANIKITHLEDRTPIPHNGTRPRRVKRF